SLYTGQVGGSIPSSPTILLRWSRVSNCRNCTVSFAPFQALMNRWKTAIEARQLESSAPRVLSAHLSDGECRKVRDALPDDLKALWHVDEARAVSREDKAETGRTAQNAHEARAWAARHPGKE